MSKRKKRQKTYPNTLQPQKTGSPYRTWGILALVGSLFLFILGISFIFFSYKPAHPGIELTPTSVISLLAGPLIIETLLAIVGIIGIAVGTWQNKKR